MCKKWHVPRVALNGGAGEAGEGKDRGVLRTAGGEAENAKRREPESDVEKNRMEEPFEEAAPAEYIAKKEADSICTRTPQLPRRRLPSPDLPG